MKKKKLETVLLSRLKQAIGTVDIARCSESELSKVLGDAGRAFVMAREFNPKELNN